MRHWVALDFIGHGLSVDGGNGGVFTGGGDTEQSVGGKDGDLGEELLQCESTGLVVGCRKFAADVKVLTIDHRYSMLVSDPTSFPICLLLRALD